MFIKSLVYFILTFLSCNQPKLLPVEHWLNQVFEDFSTSLMYSEEVISSDHCLNTTFVPQELKKFDVSGQKVLDKELLLNWGQYFLPSLELGNKYQEILDSVDFSKIYTPYKENSFDLNKINHIFKSACKMDKYVGGMFDITQISKPYFSVDKKYMFIYRLYIGNGIDTGQENLLIYRIDNEKLELLHSISLYL